MLCSKCQILLPILLSCNSIGLKAESKTVEPWFPEISLSISLFPQRQSPSLIIGLPFSSYLFKETIMISQPYVLAMGCLCYQHPNFHCSIFNTLFTRLLNGDGMWLSATIGVWVEFPSRYISLVLFALASIRLHLGSNNLIQTCVVCYTCIDGNGYKL